MKHFWLHSCATGATWINKVEVIMPAVLYSHRWLCLCFDLTVFLCLPEADGSSSLSESSSVRHQPGPCRPRGPIPCKHRWVDRSVSQKHSTDIKQKVNGSVHTYQPSVCVSSLLQTSGTLSTTRRWWSSTASDRTEASWHHSTCSLHALIRWLSLTPPPLWSVEPRLKN